MRGICALQLVIGVPFGLILEDSNTLRVSLFRAWIEISICSSHILKYMLPRMVFALCLNNKYERKATTLYS